MLLPALDFQFDVGIALAEYGHDPGQHLHCPLNRDSQTQGAVPFILDVRDFMKQVRTDGNDLFYGRNILFPRFCKHDGFSIAKKDRCTKIFFHSLDGLAQGRL